jgi:transposase-like protein
VERPDVTYRDNQLGQAEARAAASTTMSTLADRVAALERENRELRAANSVLTAAAAIFAREVTPFPVAKRHR